MTQPVFPLYELTPLGTNALKRLGKRIGARETLCPDEQDLYRAFISDAQTRMNAMLSVIGAIRDGAAVRLPRLESAEIVGRVKTLSTLADKLERDPTQKLPSVHDVVGIRIVAPMSRLEQTIVVDALCTVFDDTVQCTRRADVIDRIGQPSFGYRATHIVVWPSGRPIEIQVRTELQHAWAQQMEAFGDAWGREVRYGHPMKGSPSQIEERETVRKAMMAISDAISAHEEKNKLLGAEHIAFSSEDWDPQISTALGKWIENNRESAKRDEGLLKELLGSLNDVV
ncbi:hypothetical protein ACFRFH_12820 [Leifsonia sp. NPDC056824]|uniref:hypothetical protein n=1 Tax=Leifsonia sp. NPDC056824 TaxID=3345953 RepID=UPI0036BBC8D5